MRTVIVGNSGSGKSWLATQLSGRGGAPVVHLDDLFWMPGGFNVKRPPAEVAALVAASRTGTAWIVEGVFGNLAREFLPRASVLIWLDLPVDVCKPRLELRGSQSKAHMGREQSERGLRELLAWASGYGTRQGSTGRAAHAALFDGFAGERFRFGSESEVNEYLQALQSSQPWPQT